MSVEHRLRAVLQSVISEDPPSDLVAGANADLPDRPSSRGSWFATARALATGVLILVVAGVATAGLVLRPSERPSVATTTSDAPSEAPTAGEATPRVTEHPGPADTTTAPNPTLPTRPPTSEPTPSTEPTPDPDLTEDERSDLYWARVTHFDVYGHTYSSLADITRAAHLVVRGTLTDLQPGQVQPFGEDLPAEIAEPYPEIFGIVAVHEVLKGDPIMRTPGIIEVAGLGRSSMTVADLPQDEFILFVMNHARQREEGGRPPSDDPDDRYHYERPNGYQCVLRNVDGVVDVIEGPPGWREVLGPFPSDLHRRPFEEVVESVRALARSSSR